jgi:hypothetical protein
MFAALKKNKNVQAIHHNGKEIYRSKFVHHVHKHSKAYVHPSLKFTNKNFSPLLRELLRAVDGHPQGDIVFGDNFTEWYYRKLTATKLYADYGEIGEQHQRHMEAELIRFLNDNPRK